MKNQIIKELIKLADTHSIYLKNNELVLLPINSCEFEFIASLDEAACELQYPECQEYWDDLNFSTPLDLAMSLYRHSKIFNYKI
jgi:hypothetical protein